MDPSSLIFVAIIAIWAAYLLGHWVRRRDQLATARSIDRFSAAMRVLERRDPAPAVHAAGRAYVVAPVRVRPAPPARNRPASPARDRPARLSRARISAPAARRRSALLVALAVMTVAGWLLVATTGVPWLAAVVPSVVLMGLVAALRASARHRRAVRRHAGRPVVSGRAVVPNQATSRGVRMAQISERATGAVAPVHIEPVHIEPVHVEPATVEPVHVEPATAEPASVEPAGEPSPVAAVLPDTPAGDVRPGAELRAAAPVPVDRSWQPVPVPPPTYSLKPKAPVVVRPQSGEVTAPAEASAPDSPQPAPPFDLDEILERRISAGG